MRTRPVITCTTLLVTVFISFVQAAPPEPQPSSIRWKENVHPIRDALSLVCRITGVSFDWKKAYGGYHDIGFIAEDIGRIIPEVVQWETPGEDAVAVKYEKLTPVLVEAIKDLNSKSVNHQSLLDSQTVQLTSHDDEITSHSKAFDTQDKRLVGLLKQMESMNKQMEELKAENEARMAEIDELRDQLDQVQETCQEAANAAGVTPGTPQ